MRRLFTFRDVTSHRLPWPFLRGGREIERERGREREREGGKERKTTPHTLSLSQGLLTVGRGVRVARDAAHRVGRRRSPSAHRWPVARDLHRLHLELRAHGLGSRRHCHCSRARDGLWCAGYRLTRTTTSAPYAHAPRHARLCHARRGHGNWRPL